MLKKMLKFTDIGQQNPPKREIDLRKDDFKEIYDEFINEKATQQSSRCSQCGVPFCQVHCPLSNNIPDWLKLTAEGRLQEAYELSQSTNNMPEVCGRICPQDRLCEGNCVIEQSGHGTVTIGSVEKYITDKYSNPQGIHHYEITQSSGPQTGNGPSDYSHKLEVNSTEAGAESVSNYEYEQRLQDQKRQIKLLDKAYLNQFVDEFERLVQR